MKHLIQDYNQFNTFVNDVLPELQKDEVYFISMSARKKYLTLDEREKYQLARTEMFARKVVHDKTQLQHAMDELSAQMSVRTTKSGLKMPEKALVTYINVNPSSMIKALTLFKKDMDHELNQIMSTLISDGEPNFDAVKYATRKFMNCVQKSKGTRHYLDIDVDSLDEQYKDQLVAQLNDIENHVLETHGGFHVLINREQLNGSGIQLHKIVREIDNELKKIDSECIFNKNAMIPVPGSLHAGKLVKLL